MDSSPERDAMLTYEQLEPILTGLFESVPSLFLIVFAGGEPTLLGDDLLKAIRLCKQHRRRTRIVTNGYWARSMESARTMVRALRDAGLDELNISTDDYHLPYISLQRVRNAYAASLELDFDCVAIATCAGPESALVPDQLNREFGQGEMLLRFDENGVTIKHDFDLNGTNVMLSNCDVQRLGRADQSLFLSESSDYGNRNWQQGCPWAVRSASITAQGHLVACCGFQVHGNEILDYGSALERPVGELLDDADSDLVTNMIALIGPQRIRDLLREICPEDIVVPDSAVSPCEVCQHIVTSPSNRRALYTHIESFVPVILQGRRELMEKHRVGDRVELPDAVQLLVSLRSHDEQRPVPDSPV
jgi:hypothetical protein